MRWPFKYGLLKITVLQTILLKWLKKNGILNGSCRGMKRGREILFLFRNQFILSFICLGLTFLGFYLVLSNLKIKKEQANSNDFLLAILGVLLVILGSFSLCFILIFG